MMYFGPSSTSKLSLSTAIKVIGVSLWFVFLSPRLSAKTKVPPTKTATSSKDIVKLSKDPYIIGGRQIPKHIPKAFTLKTGDTSLVHQIKGQRHSLVIGSKKFTHPSYAPILIHLSSAKIQGRLVFLSLWQVGRNENLVIIDEKAKVQKDISTEADRGRIKVRWVKPNHQLLIEIHRNDGKGFEKITQKWP